MHKIVIKDQYDATKAINWCKAHLLKDKWDVHTNWPAIGFIFSFNNTQDASWFGLHCVH